MATHKFSTVWTQTKNYALSGLVNEEDWGKLICQAVYPLTPDTAKNCVLLGTIAYNLTAFCGADTNLLLDLIDERTLFIENNPTILAHELARKDSDRLTAHDILTLVLHVEDARNKFNKIASGFVPAFAQVHPEIY